MGELTPGALIDEKYRIVRTLGEGGMGVVFVAEHIFLRKHFALKLLRQEYATNSEAAVRFAQEAQATSRLEHPNIVRVSDFGRTSDGELYLVMELLTGRSLAAELATLGHLPQARAVRIANQVLHALEAAHSEGIVHRDLKPENVFLCPIPGGAEGVKLLDFGIAKLSNETNLRLTTTGSVMGTPQYMAPEQARGVPDLDARVDLHAVGAILYEMIAGKAAYTGDNYHQVLAAILTVPPADLLEAAPGTDPALCQVITRSLAKDRNERYSSARELRDALEACEALAAVGDLPLHAELMPLDAPVAPDAGAESGPRFTMPRPLVVTDLRAASPTFAAPLLPEPLVMQSAAPAPPEPKPVAKPEPAKPAEPEDPFAPPDEKLEQPLELAIAQRAQRVEHRPPLAGAAQPAVAAYVELNAFKKAAETPRIFRRVVIGLVVVLAIGLVAAARGWVEEVPEIRPAKPSKASVRLDQVPEKAYVTLDGVRTVLNPIEMTLSSQPHELRIECEGYRPRTVLFVASQPEVVVDAHLERLPPRKGGKPSGHRGGMSGDSRTSLLAPN